VCCKQVDNQRHNCFKKLTLLCGIKRTMNPPVEFFKVHSELSIDIQESNKRGENERG